MSDIDYFVSYNFAWNNSMIFSILCFISQNLQWPVAAMLLKYKQNNTICLKVAYLSQQLPTPTTVTVQVKV